MASGVQVCERVKRLINDIKVLKNNADPSDRMRIVVLSIQGDCIDMEKIYTEKELVGRDPYKVIKEIMKPDCCRYILYDCHYATKETSCKEDLVYMLWCPDSAKIKDKMCYAASNDAVAKCLSGIKHKLQMNDLGDISSRLCLAEKLGKDIITLEGHKCSCGDDDDDDD
ncbi:cofilin-2-like [Symphorus nematophorus]